MHLFQENERTNANVGLRISKTILGNAENKKALSDLGNKGINQFTYGEQRNKYAPSPWRASLLLGDTR